jgi:hypothetical protein
LPVSSLSLSLSLRPRDHERCKQRASVTSLPRAHTFSLSLSLSLSHTHTHVHTHTLSVSFPLFSLSPLLSLNTIFHSTHRRALRLRRGLWGSSLLLQLAIAACYCSGVAAIASCNPIALARRSKAACYCPRATCTQPHTNPLLTLLNHLVARTRTLPCLPATLFRRFVLSRPICAGGRWRQVEGGGGRGEEGGFGVREADCTVTVSTATYQQARQNTGEREGDPQRVTPPSPLTPHPSPLTPHPSPL